MQRFDICRIRGVAGMTHGVVLQSEFYDFLPTRLIAPLWRETTGDFIENITPRLQFEDAAWLVRIDLTVGMFTPSIGAIVGSARDMQDDITRALDRLMAGF